MTSIEICNWRDSYPITLEKAKLWGWTIASISASEVYSLSESESFETVLLNTLREVRSSDFWARLTINENKVSSPYNERVFPQKQDRLNVDFLIPTTAYKS